MRHSAEYSQEEAGRYSHKVRFPHNLLNSPTIEWNLVSFWRFSGGKGGHVGHAGLGDILKSQISSHFTRYSDSRAESENFYQPTVLKTRGKGEILESQIYSQLI